MHFARCEEIAENTFVFLYLEKKVQITVSGRLSLTSTGNSILYHWTEEYQLFIKALVHQYGEWKSKKRNTNDRDSPKLWHVFCFIFV